MITFIEHKSDKYPERTKENANADVTLAFAIDFQSPGEIITRKYSIEQGRLYFPIDLMKSFEGVSEKIAKGIDRNRERLFDNRKLIVNVAGNGIWDLKNWYSQADMDELVLKILRDTIFRLDFEECEIRSGGQTGADEAGAKAGNLMEFPTTVLAPKGWKFRNIDGIDICNERLFKKRFLVTNHQI